jgi:hypothetical protein
LVVPALYALWFRVRADEILERIIEPEGDERLGWGPVPVQVAAE